MASVDEICRIKGLGGFLFVVFKAVTSKGSLKTLKRLFEALSKVFERPLKGLLTILQKAF